MGGAQRWSCVLNCEQEEKSGLMAGRYLCQRVGLGYSRLLSTGLGSGRERVFVVGVGMTKFQKVL